jgi:membrane-bound serine protease (ClpP class)
MVQHIRGIAVRIVPGLVAAALFGASGLGSAAFAQQPLAQQPIVDKLVLADTIQPVTAGQLDRAIARANSDGAQALLVELDTPGGLLDSTRGMVGAILGSRVPVIVYVAPGGARAGSAGFFLLEAADVAAMAPGTNAGAAHPVIEFGSQPDATMSEKIENDAEAFLRSYVTGRNRNAKAAEAAVHSSHSYTAEEALDQHLIDLTSTSDAQLLTALDGRTITRIDGTKLVLHLAGARIEVLQPTLRESLLGWLVNPNIALLMLVGGALLIYLEFNTPGTIVPGALGTLMVLLAIFGLNLLPIRYTAVLLLVAALALLLLEVWRPRCAGDRGNRLPDLWDAYPGCRAGAGDGDQPGRRSGSECGICGHYGLSGAAGSAGAPHEDPAGRRGPGWQQGHGHGAADTRGPRAGGGRNLARGCPGASGRRQPAARGGT